MYENRAPREEFDVTCAECGKATTVPFKVGSIGNGNWIQVTVAVTVAGRTSTLEMQVH